MQVRARARACVWGCVRVCVCVSPPHPSQPIHRYVDVVEAMKQGTVVFNSAGANIPKLSAMCLAALEAFQLPNCLNL